MSNCVVCNKPTDFVCNGCQNVRYCGRECQKTDWNSHKFTCNARIFKDQLTNSTRTGIKSSITNSIIIPVKWPSGFMINFNVMVVPKEETKPDYQNPLKIKDNDDMTIDEQSEFEALFGWEGADEKLEKALADYKMIDNKIQLIVENLVDKWSDEWGDDAFLTEEEKDEEIRKKTEELMKERKRSYDIYHKRQFELRLQTKILDYIYSKDAGDYYIADRNFYFVAESPEPYNTLLAIFKRLNTSNTNTSNTNTSNTNTSNTNTSNIDPNIFYERMFLTLFLESIKTAVRTAVIKELSEDDFKNISDENQKKKKKKMIDDLDEEPKNDNTIIEPVLKTITPKLVFTTCSNPKYSSFMSKNNVKFSSIKNAYILLQQLFEQNGENSLKKDGGFITSLSNWTRMGFKVKEDQKPLKTVVLSKSYENLKINVRSAGYDRSQVEPFKDKAKIKFTAFVNFEHKNGKFILADDISMVELFDHFKKDYKKLPEKLKKTIKRDINIVNLMNTLENIYSPHEMEKIYDLGTAIHLRDLLNYNFGPRKHNKWRIAFHILASHVLKNNNEMTNASKVFASEIISLLTCNMIGIGDLEFYNRVMTEIKRAEETDSIIPLFLDDSFYKSVVDVSDELLRYVGKSTNKKD